MANCESVYQGLSKKEPANRPVKIPDKTPPNIDWQRRRPMRRAPDSRKRQHRK